jgi:ESCRT-I complex subunit VPS28
MDGICFQYFITLMDTLKLNMFAVDQLHPILGDLMQSLGKVRTLRDNYGVHKEKLRHWYTHSGATVSGS